MCMKCSFMISPGKSGVSQKSLIPSAVDRGTSECKQGVDLISVHFFSTQHDNHVQCASGLAGKKFCLVLQSPRGNEQVLLEGMPDSRLSYLNGTVGFLKSDTILLTNHFPFFSCSLFAIYFSDA